VNCVVALNFVKVADNRIKMCSLAYVETYNRPVKFGLQIPNRFGKISENPRGDCFDSLV